MNKSELALFLRQLWLQGVEFWLEGEHLRFRGNKQLVSGETLALLRDNKATIIELIKAEPEAYLGFPLSHGQRGIYLMQNLEPTSSAFNLVCLLQLQSDLQINILQSSFDFLLQRHAPLRMSIEEVDGYLAQQVSYSLPNILQIHDANALSITCPETWLKTEADKPFNLSNEPLIRAHLLVNHQQNSHHLLLVVHHIVADFWAMDIFIKELAIIYQASLVESTPKLPEIGKLYKDFVTHESAWLTSEAGLKAKTWWNKQLQTLPQALELPKDEHHQHQDFSGVETSFTLGSLLTEQLKQKAKETHVTTFVWILSIYQLLLHRYTGEDRIAIGSPMACRTQHDFQLLAGHFTNPVVLLCNFQKTTTINQLLAFNKDNVLQAMKYQEYPLQVLLEDLHDKRENASAPLFHAVLSWNQVNETELHNKLIKDVLITEQRGTLYDIVLTGFDEGDDIQLAWRYNTETFKKATIKRFNAHFIALLTASLENANIPISEYDFLTPQEKTQLTLINQTHTTIARDISLAKLFQDIAHQYPNATALKDGHISYSYMALEQQSNQMAHYLLTQGVKPKDHIALCLHRSFDMLVAILATLKNGCTYVPVDSAYPNDRIAYMSMQSNAPIMISSKRLREKMAALGEHNNTIAIQFIEDINLELTQYSTEFTCYNNGSIHEDDVACVLYTSGSTGKPKGVKTPHRAIIRLCTNTNFFSFAAFDKFLYLSNISFDAINIEIWGSFLNGGCLIQVDQDTLLHPPKFSALIDQEKPHAALITTALFNIFITYKPDMFACFNYIFVGGEALDINPVRRCIEHGKPKHLLNIYGPTENGTISTTFDLIDPHLRIIPIGKPISNSHVYVQDKYGKPTPFNVMGEIFVGGDGIATGYQSQEALTAERFIFDHYRQQGLLYATGDLGYFRDDGQLMYAGRRDDQVKIRGYRIELGEIEQALSQHPHINECCVLINRDKKIPALHAYYASDIIIDSHTIKTFLRQTLPEFMIPQATLQLDNLPITPNGKLDKRQLPRIIIEENNDIIEPRNLTEKTISDIWRNHLHLEKISVNDNFFELGGHSLLAIKVASDIHHALHVDISMRLLFEHPTIAELADAIVNNSKNDLPTIVATNDTEAIKASLNQQRLWFLQQLNPDAIAYNMPIALRIIKPINHLFIQQSLQTLVHRHQSLRTRFHDVDGIAYLHISSPNDVALPFIDVSELKQNEANEKANGLLTQLAQHHFQLAEEPLFKTLLIKVSSQEHILGICLHHLIADGMSVDILLNELAILWQYNNDAQSHLPPLAIQYSDFSLWQHQWSKSEALSNQLVYWKNQLSDAPTLINLPTDKPRPAVLGNDGAQHHFTIPTHIVSQLKTLSTKNGATLFMSLLAAYSLLLSRYSQQRDICIGFPIAGRNQSSVQPLVGLFVNNLIARCYLDTPISVNAYIQQIKQTTINAYAHQDVPFDLIIDALNIERSLSYIPFLQASFSFENSSFNEKISQVMGSDICLEPLDGFVAKYDLHLTCFDTNSSHLVATIDYNIELFDASTIERISQHFIALLEAMCSKPETTIDKVEFLSDLEFQQQMDFSQGWNATQYQHIETDSLHHLIEQQANKTPTAIAVMDEQQSLTYAQLNTQANALAHYLRSLGATRNTPVAVMLDRSVFMSVALLGILKAGAAYTPITSDLPANRIQFICSDTQTKILITQHSIHLPKLPDYITVVYAENAKQWQHYPTTNPTAITNKADLFNIIYTSGSTGNPKGVMVPHRGIINRLQWMQSAYPIGLPDTVLQKTPFNFDVSVWELFWPLMQGSCLYFAKPEGHKDPIYLRDTIIQQGITTLHFVPSMLGVFLQTDRIEQCQSLKYIFASGEALQLNQANTTSQRLTHAALINLYGPTEASVDVSYYHCQPHETHSSIAIGKPIHNTQLHILDQHLNILPIGVAGDLYIGGEGLALGYWNQEKLTKSVFIENPWFKKGHPSPYLYKTFDLARYRADGNIEYLGRSDHQIKIRGLRVELGEIEKAISAYTNSQESIVVLDNHIQTGQRLIAYLLGKEPINATQLITQLKQQLPEYMIPSAFVTLAHWPLSANGKIDRKQLPLPSSQHALEFIAPRNETESLLVEIWQTLLKVEKIGIHDNFFELGGHSLLATQMASRIRDQFLCHLELKAIFEYPTIGELAVHLLEKEIQNADIDEKMLAELLQELAANT